MASRIKIGGNAKHKVLVPGYSDVIAAAEVTNEWVDAYNQMVSSTDTCIKCGARYNLIDNLGTWNCLQVVEETLSTSNVLYVRADHIGARNAELFYKTSDRDGRERAYDMLKEAGIWVINRIHSQRSLWHRSGYALPYHAWPIFQKHVPLHSITPESIHSTLASYDERPTQRWGEYESDDTSEHLRFDPFNVSLGAISHSVGMTLGGQHGALSDNLMGSNTQEPQPRVQRYDWQVSEVIANGIKYGYSGRHYDSMLESLPVDPLKRPYFPEAAYYVVPRSQDH